MKIIKDYKKFENIKSEIKDTMHIPVKKQIVIIHGGDAYSEFGAFANHDAYLNKLKKYDIGNAADKYRMEKISDPEELKLMIESEKIGWHEWIANHVPNDYEVFMPNMPNAQDAVYVEWKIWFEKLLPYINNDAIFIGHSLGGIFLTKYFSENPQTKVKALILVAAPIRFGENGYRGGFILKKDNVSKLGKIKNLYFLQSKNDPCVPYLTIFKYKNLIPSAQLIIFENKGHFNMTVFPELLNLVEKIG